MLICKIDRIINKNTIFEVHEIVVFEAEGIMK